MWLHNFYSLSLIIVTLLIKCYFVENKGPKEEMYGSVYLAKNVAHTQIKNEFLKIMNSVLHAMESTGKLYLNRRDIELKGTIVILKHIENDNYETRSEEGITNSNYRTNSHSKRLEKLKDNVDFREGLRKIIVAIVDNRKERETFARNGLNIEDSSFEPMNLQKDNRKTNVKRETHVDRCIKKFVGKCFKALAAVYKTVCKVRYRCSSSFQSYFIGKSIEGCKRNFDSSKELLINNNKKKRTSAKFRDATRERYLDAGIPYMLPNYKKLSRTITLRNGTLTNDIANILRKKSKSKKECPKFPRAKCATACFFALRESCAKFKCYERSRMAFNKACKEECRRAYRVIRSDSSSSSSSD